MRTSDSIAKLAKAMVAVGLDPAWGSIGKDKTAKVPTKAGGQYSYDYADLSTCYEQIVPLFAKHGIAIFQPTRTQGTDVIVTTILAHEGEFISEEFTVPAGDRGAQALGSAATYAKRYALLGMCSIASTNEDDDGKAAHDAARQAKPPPKPTPAAKQETAKKSAQATADAAQPANLLDLTTLQAALGRVQSDKQLEELLPMVKWHTKGDKKHPLFAVYAGVYRDLHPGPVVDPADFKRPPTHPTAAETAGTDPFGEDDGPPDPDPTNGQGWTARLPGR